VKSWLKEPFGQAVVILVIAFLLIEFGIPYIPPLLGFASAPAPNSVVFQYMLTVALGVLLWVSDSEERWRAFKRPMHRVMVDDSRKPIRLALMVLLPALVAFIAYGQARPSLAAPPSFRAIHPAPPGSINFQGRAMELTGLENPLRARGDLAQHYEEGKRVYYQNCLACHGDLLDGAGHYAGAFNPAPLSFQDVGTIGQLTESYVFWRIAKGGIGLPNEGGPWNSAMPAWEEFLTEDEIWSVIIFLYDQANKTPRTWEEVEGAERAGEGNVPEEEAP
jgi:mono/diheme cytochrome c family protein